MLKEVRAKVMQNLIGKHLRHRFKINGNLRSFSIIFGFQISYDRLFNYSLSNNIPKFLYVKLESIDVFDIFKIGFFCYIFVQKFQRTFDEFCSSQFRPNKFLAKI